jgi:hypothetical protein
MAVKTRINVTWFVDETNAPINGTTPPAVKAIADATAA